MQHKNQLQSVCWNFEKLAKRVSQMKYTNYHSRHEFRIAKVCCCQEEVHDLGWEADKVVGAPSWPLKRGEQGKYTPKELATPQSSGEYSRVSGLRVSGRVDGTEAMLPIMLPGSTWHSAHWHTTYSAVGLQLTLAVYRCLVGPAKSGGNGRVSASPRAQCPFTTTVTMRQPSLSAWNTGWSCWWWWPGTDAVSAAFASAAAADGADVWKQCSRRAARVEWVANANRLDRIAAQHTHALTDSLFLSSLGRSFRTRLTLLGFGLFHSRRSRCLATMQPSAPLSTSSSISVLIFALCLWLCVWRSAWFKRLHFITKW